MKLNNRILTKLDNQNLDFSWKKNSVLLNLRILEAKIYKKKSEYITSLFEIEEKLVQFKIALSIIYSYHYSNKKILFIGIPNNLIFLSKKIRHQHAFLPANVWLNGIFANKSSTRRYLRYQKLKKISINKFLNIIKFPKLIVLINSTTNSEILNEIYQLRIPIITLNLTKINSDKFMYPISTDSINDLYFKFIFLNLLNSLFVKNKKFLRLLKNRIHMNIKLRKRRYKPLYKKLLGLKKNVQNRLKLLHFKKKKWRKFIEQLKRIPYNKKHNFRFYDQSCDYVSKFQNQFKWNFKNLLQSKKRFTYFYGQLLQKYFQIQIRLAKKKRKVLNQRNWIFSKILANFFERRLDTILYRSHFAYSMRHAKQLIFHKYIQVNGKTINLSSYKIKNGDLISLVKKKKDLLNKNNLTYLLSNFWPIPQNHLQINYQTYQIVFVENLDTDSIILMFPFHLKWN